jgi:hypothetical protein
MKRQYWLSYRQLDIHRKPRYNILRESHTVLLRSAKRKSDERTHEAPWRKP